MESKLLDTAPLRDQRTMVDVSHETGAHRTPGEVEEAWARWASREGLPVRRRQGDFSTDLRESPKTVVIYISAGKWIGNCPTCSGGVAGWPNYPRGCCLDCGTIYRLDYPPEQETLELAALMGGRAEKDRNYFRHLGEPIDVVRAEQPRYEQQADSTGVIDLAALKAALTPKAYAELKRAGVIG